MQKSLPDDCAESRKKLHKETRALWKSQHWLQRCEILSEKVNLLHNYQITWMRRGDITFLSLCQTLYLSIYLTSYVSPSLQIISGLKSRQHSEARDTSLPAILLHEYLWKVAKHPAQRDPPPAKIERGKKSSSSEEDKRSLEANSGKWTRKEHGCESFLNKI